MRRSVSKEIASSLRLSTVVNSRTERIVRIVRWWLKGVVSSGLDIRRAAAFLQVESREAAVVSVSRRETRRRECQ